jgi:hypothetical protein
MAVIFSGSTFTFGRAMRKYLFFILLLIVAGVVAAQKSYVYLTNLKPTKMTCRQFLDSNSSKKWVELSDCQVDYLEGTTLQSLVLKIDKGSYLPVRPPGSEGPARLLLKIKSDDLIPRLTSLVAASKSGGQSAPSTETVKGLIIFGLDVEEKVRHALESDVTAGKLQSDYMIIEDGASPDAGEAVGSTIVFALLCLVVWAFFKGRRKALAAKAKMPPPLPGAMNMTSGL